MAMIRGGQGEHRRPGHRQYDDDGFVLVALLVGMAVAAVWMGAALPAWRHQALRDKETELIFRGEQYARAIVLYQRKNQGAYPPSIDTLVSDRYLRKKWKDPVTGKDFLPVGIGQPGAPAGSQGGARGATPAVPQGRGTGPTQGGFAPAGIIGVRSASQATSIKIYRQQQQHSLWPFDAAQLYAKMGYSPAANRGGGPARGGAPGRGGDGRGGPGTGPGRGGREGGPITLPGRGGRGPGPTAPGRGRGGF